MKIPRWFCYMFDLPYEIPKDYKKSQKAFVVKRQLSKKVKKPRVKKLSDERIRQISESLYKKYGPMVLSEMWKATHPPVKIINDEPLLGTSKTKRTVGRRKPRRSVCLSVPSTKVGAREDGRVYGLHDKKAGTKKVRPIKNKGGKSNKVHNKRSKAPHKPVRGKAKNDLNTDYE